MGHQEATNPDVDHTKPKWTLTFFFGFQSFNTCCCTESIEVRLLSERPKAKTLDNRPKWQVIYHIQPFLAVLFKHGSGLEMMLLPSSKRRLNISPAAVVFLRFFHPIWNGKMALLLNFLWCHLGGPHLSSNAKNGGFCQMTKYIKR